ncbi:hypothetical protein Tco_0298009 [Tanacetum coccineum]
MIASTQAFIDAVTTALPSPPLPPLPPSLYIPLPVDRRDDTPEFEQPPHKRVIELAELHEINTQDLYSLLEDAQDRYNMDGKGGGLCFLRGLGSLDRIESGDPLRALDPL